jgi:hypothetical protein
MAYQRYAFEVALATAGGIRAATSARPSLVVLRGASFTVCILSRFGPPSGVDGLLIIPRGNDLSTFAIGRIRLSRLVASRRLLGHQSGLASQGRWIFRLRK